MVTSPSLPAGFPGREGEAWGTWRRVAGMWTTKGRRAPGFSRSLGSPSPTPRRQGAGLLLKPGPPGVRFEGPNTAR